MTLRSAVRQSTVLTFVVLAAFVWVLLSLLSVMQQFDWLAVLSTDYIGQNAAGGIAGVVVLAVLLGALIFLSSEMGEGEPAPEQWPPSEE
ncbi:MAG: hypothetical protein ACOCY1_02410 [Halovenus sp.]